MKLPGLSLYCQPIRQNIPPKPEIAKSWVVEFHSVLNRVEETTGLSMGEFRISRMQLHRETLGAHPKTGQVYVVGAIVVDRTHFLFKVDAALAYFTNQEPDRT
jgi:hypothetical protein